MPTTEEIGLGSVCGFLNDCAGGLVCLTSEVLPTCDGASCCGAFCELSLGDGPCEAAMPGTVCTAFFEEGAAPEGYEDVGVCVVPGA